jgi:hypothetical protein
MTNDHPVICIPGKFAIEAILAEGHGWSVVSLEQIVVREFLVALSAAFRGVG